MAKHDHNKELMEIGISTLSVNAEVKSDNTVKVAAILKSCTVVDRRPGKNAGFTQYVSQPLIYIKYSLELLRPIKTAEAFEAVYWLADLPQRTWPKAGRR